jgi:hypothetical protein
MFEDERRIQAMERRRMKKNFIEFFLLFMLSS